MENAHEYFYELVNLKREGNETYRGLSSRIDKDVRRSIEDKDPLETLLDECLLNDVSQFTSSIKLEKKGKKKNNTKQSNNNIFLDTTHNLTR